MPEGYLRKVQPSPEGKVHYAEVAHKTRGVELFNPLCNHRSWIGDYWGKKWVPVSDDTEVTCKNCLSARGELVREVKVELKGHRIIIERHLKKFKTPGEASAYIQGLKDATGWKRFPILINGRTI